MTEVVNRSFYFRPSKAPAPKVYLKERKAGASSRLYPELGQAARAGSSKEIKWERVLLAFVKAWRALLPPGVRVRPRRRAR